MTRKFLGLLLSLLALTAFERGAHATTTLKIGTIAPQDSPWGHEFKQWAKEVADDSHGEVTLDFLWNAQAGDEPLMVQKIRAGQIDGAAVTPLGLGQTGVSNIMLFTLPGLFTTWQKLDQVRDAVKDDLVKEFQQKGFTIVGWGDVGALKEMTVGFEIHHPTDLRGRSVYYFIGDPITPKVYAAIGGINPRPLNLTEVLQALTTKSIDVVMAPPLGAEQLQWASHVDHISTQTLAYAIGAVIMSSSRLAAMPANLRQIVLDRGAQASDRLQKRIRNLDAQAYARMKASKTAYDPSPAEVAEWAPIFMKVGLDLRGSMFTPALFDRVVAMADNPILQDQIRKLLKEGNAVVREMAEKALKSDDPTVRAAAQKVFN
jgi:TRAP-type C4-dicarboxylate transport system substrate-binding protein